MKVSIFFWYYIMKYNTAKVSVQGSWCHCIQKNACFEEYREPKYLNFQFLYTSQRIRICLIIFLWTKTKHITLIKKWTVLSFLNLIHHTQYSNNPGQTLNWNYYWSLQFLLFQKNMLIAASQILLLEMCMHESVYFSEFRW